MKCVIIYGIYDLFYYGYIELFCCVREMGDYLIVVLLIDEFN